MRYGIWRPRWTGAYDYGRSTDARRSLWLIRAERCCGAAIPARGAMLESYGSRKRGCWACEKCSGCARGQRRCSTLKREDHGCGHPPTNLAASRDEPAIVGPVSADSGKAIRFWLRGGRSYRSWVRRWSRARRAASVAFRSVSGLAPNRAPFDFACAIAAFVRSLISCDSCSAITAIS